MPDTPPVPPDAAETVNAADPTERLRQLWRLGPPPDVDAFLADAGPLPPAQVAAVLRVDQRLRWQRGERVPAEDYLRRHAAVGADPEGALDLIFHEFLLRQRRGENPTAEEYQRRFPEHADTLRDQIELQHALADAPGPREGPPDVPGFEILGELGRGGMGVVYEARQVALGRTVALKVLLAGGYAGAEERARFRAEAAAVARLQHPNVVQIHEVGERDGLPYFALEFCPGGSLAGRLDGTPWAAARAAGLVETLARAVHAAHDAGVVHRDLKPANVLLTAAGEPKVADFGLAKRLDGAAGPTRSGAVMGTPSYMAPEQASGKAKEVGPAADVYALGAVLYELLTGRPPFKGETPLDTLAQVVAEEPVPVRRLQPKVPRDLETACHKCLHKEPAQRYASAAALADDLRRFLDGRPVLARPVGPVARLGRWCRRRPAVAGLAAALALVLAGGLGGLTALWLRAEHLRRVAEHERAEAAADFRLARESVDGYVTRVNESLRLRDHDLRPLRKELLGQAVPLYEQLAERHADRPELLAERGRAYKRLAEITAEIADKGKAVPLFEKAVGVLEQAARAEPGVPQHQRDLTACRSHLAELYHATGRAAEARAEFQKLLAFHEAKAGEHPGDPAVRKDLAQTHNSLAVSYLETGEPARGLSHAREAVAALGRLADEHPDVPDYPRHLAVCRATLAALYDRTGSGPEAGAEFRKAVAALEGLVRRHPANGGSDYELAMARRDLAAWCARTGAGAEAAAHLRQALDELKDLIRRHPSVTDYHRALATCLSLLADQDRRTGRDAEARAAYEQAVGFLKKLVDQDPHTPVHRHSLAGAHNGLAGLHWQAGRKPEAEEGFKEAVRIRTGLADQNPGFPAYQHDLGLAHMNLAAVYQATGRPAPAAAEFQKALAVLQPLTDKAPSVKEYQTTLARCRINLGGMYFQTGRSAPALEEYEQALRVFKELARPDPAAHRYAQEVGLICSSLGTVAHDRGEPEAALPWFGEAVAAFEAVLHKEANDVAARRQLRNALCERARSLNRLGRAADALDDCDRALTIDTGQPQAATRALRALTLARLGRHAPALAEADELGRAGGLSGIAHHELACLYALAAAAAARDGNLPPAARAARAERYAARAVELLGQARAARFYNRPSRVEQLNTDGDFAALRARADFQALLAEVKAASTAP